MPESFVQHPPDSVAAGRNVRRTRQRTVSGLTIEEPTLLSPWGVGRDGALYLSTSARVAFVANANTALFSIYNPADVPAGHVVALRRMSIQADHTGGTGTTLLPRLNLLRTVGAPTGGVTATPVKFDTTDPDPLAVLRQRTATNDTAGTVITVPATGSRSWSQYTPRMAGANNAAAQQLQFDDSNLAPSLAASNPPILAADQAYSIYTVLPVTTTITVYYTINVAWEEYVLP